MGDIIRKSSGPVEVKLDTAGEGTFEAVFATMNKVDKDGDVTERGAFGEQDVVISQWNHGSWSSGAAGLPIGVGKIFERGDDAVVRGEFDLDDEDGKKTYKKLKYLHDKGRRVEWSYALPHIDYRMGDFDGREVRYLEKIEVPEVSPVLMGAGVDTRLLAIKGAKSKTAIPSHDAGTTEENWSAADVRRNIKEDQGYSYYRRIFAWAPTDTEDRAKKSTYKFPHHEVSADGAPGAANMRGCSAAIAVLNGGRGGADIPDTERRGVYNHVAKHLRDGDKDVPELRSYSLDSLSDKPHKRFVDELEETVVTVECTLERALKISELSHVAGRRMSRRSFRRLKALADTVQGIHVELAGLVNLHETREADKGNANKELASLLSGNTE